MNMFAAGKAGKDPHRQHLVRFYQGEYPADRAAEFLAAGLLAGEGCVALLTQSRRDAVEQRLQARGIVLGPDGSYSTSYFPIDTDQALQALMTDGRLDTARANAVLESLFNNATQGGARALRLAGDPAPVLYAAGRVQEALALEQLVDIQAAAYGAAVLCAYPIASICRESGLRSILGICGEHAALEFPDGLWLGAPGIESASTN